MLLKPTFTVTDRAQHFMCGAAPVTAVAGPTSPCAPSYHGNRAIPMRCSRCTGTGALGRARAGDVLKAVESLQYLSVP